MSFARLLLGAAVILGFALLASALHLSRETEKTANPRSRPVAERGRVAQPVKPRQPDPKAQSGVRRFPQPPAGSRSTRLAHHEAEQLLLAAGIRRSSSGGCGDRERSVCTSLEGVRRPVIERIIAVKTQSRCPVVVTGGTEAGHADGRYSHGRGYKVDIMADRCVSDHIQRNARFVGTRGDGAATYRASDGTVYYRESDHWDILVRS